MTKKYYITYNGVKLLQEWATDHAESEFQHNRKTALKGFNKIKRYLTTTAHEINGDQLCYISTGIYAGLFNASSDAYILKNGYKYDFNAIALTTDLKPVAVFSKMLNGEEVKTIYYIIKG